MKKDIHPSYQPSVIECACGNTVQTYSTRGSYKVEICSACHPFYTGKQKLVDSAGRIERFHKKYAIVAGKQPMAKGNAAPAPKASGENA